MQTHTSSVARFAHPPRNVDAMGIDAGMTVADFGAGSGAYALLLAQAVGESGRVYAIDAQSDLLRRIKNEAEHKGLKNIDIISADLERPRGTKIADRTLDLVLMSNILFQLEKKEAALAEAYRILKPTGRLVVIDWQDSFRGMGPIREHVVDKKAAAARAAAASFELLREFDAGAHHYGLIFRLAPKSSL